MLPAARACMRVLTLAAFQLMYAVANDATACWACAAAVLTCSGGGGGDGYSCVACACWSFVGGGAAGGCVPSGGCVAAGGCAAGGCAAPGRLHPPSAAAAAATAAILARRITGPPGAEPRTRTR